jgi:hypothetical protein
VRGLVVLWLLAAAAAAPGPVNTTPPSASGTPQQGQRLGAVPGIWTGTGAVRYAYQWYRCDSAGAHCKSVHGATGVGYRLGAADAGALVGLTVAATDSTGTTSAYASLLGPVAAAGATLRSTTPPKIVGGSTVGVTATVDNGGWSGKPSSFTVAWQQCNPNGRACVPIGGATSAGYTPAPADVGHALVAVVTATAGSASQAAWSTASRPVKTAPGPVLATAPAVSGTVQQGQRLSATSGTWTGSGTIAYAYQWYRCDTTGAHCSSVHGATLATYTLAAADAGKTIGLTVRATDSTGTASAYAGLVGTVATKTAPLHATAAPAVTGSPSVGQTLTVASGSWSPATPSFTYAWLRCNANGRICTPIAGADAASYVPVADDAGHALVAVVTASAAGTTLASWSLPTAPVAPT